MACVLGVLMAAIGGSRALNAVVLPGVIALVAGYLRVSRVSHPDVRRSRPADGFVGEHRNVSLSFGNGDRRPSPSSTFVARVTDETDEGLIGNADGVRTTVGAEPTTYTVEYAARGERRFGPVRIEPTDVFGLFKRTIEVDDRETVLAYPEPHPVPERFRSHLFSEEPVGRTRGREEFQGIREYARGDRLRDVHWPTTAKNDELIVKEFTAGSPDGHVSIVGRTVDATDAAAADVLASATVSLGLALLDDGASVEVRLPDGVVLASPGSTGRGDLLELTARTGPGTPTGESEADVRLVADATDARIHVGERTVQFSRLRAEATEESNATVATDAMDSYATVATDAMDSYATVATDAMESNATATMESSGTARDDGTAEATGNGETATNERGGASK